MKARLTLKSRFTLVAAGAVAAVALAITAVAFLAIRTDLQNQVQQEIASRADSVLHLAKQEFHNGHIPNNWVPSHSSGFGLTYTQVITSAGAVRTQPQDRGCSRQARRRSTWRRARRSPSTPSPASPAPGPWC